MRILISIIVILILPLLFIGTRFAKNARDASTVPDFIQTKIDSTHEYCNSRFDFCLVYPSTFLPVHSASANNDGVKLFTENGKGKVTVVGAYNIFNWTTEELFQFNLENTFSKNSEEAIILSQKFDADHYKVHLFSAGKNIFQEAFFKGESYILFTIEADVEQSELLNELKENTALEFRKAG